MFQIDYGYENGEILYLRVEKVVAVHKSPDGWMAYMMGCEIPWYIPDKYMDALLAELDKIGA